MMKNSKFAHIVNVLYALIATFAVVGAAIRPGELPLAILLVTVLFWATGRIVGAGAMSLFALLGKDEPKDK
jgi:hypothetical protein